MSAATIAGKSLRYVLGDKAKRPPRARDSHWYTLSPARRTLAAIFGVSPTRADSHRTDQANAIRVDTPESLGLHNTREQIDETEDAVTPVRDRLDMLYAVLNTINAPSHQTPYMGSVYLNTTRRYIRRLRNGLVQQRVSKAEALRLLNLIEHNLREADKMHRHQQGLSLDDVLRGRIGDLVELGGDISEQVPVLRQMVVRLFDEADEPTSLAPTR